MACLIIKSITIIVIIIIIIIKSIIIGFTIQYLTFKPNLNLLLFY
jgi:hypothetical protein